MPSHPLSRRGFIRQTFAFSAALALGAHRRALAATDFPAGDRHLLILGDWGADPAQGTNQPAVAAAMKGYVQANKLKSEGLLLLGDNFYGPFPGGVKCPRWKTQFEDMYPADIFPGPAWTILGNHDYEDGPDIYKAVLDYKTANPASRWTIPSKWYRFDFPAKDPLVTFIALDSNYHNARLSLTPEEKASQLTWLEAELEKPRTAPFLFILGHHPLHSPGPTGENTPLIEAWEPLFKKHQPHVYFCGHDHDMMHLEFADNPTSHVISGGGGAVLTAVNKPGYGPFAQRVYGFTHLQLNKDRVIVRHVDPDQKQVHAFSKTPDGKVSILTEAAELKIPV